MSNPTDKIKAAVERDAKSNYDGWLGSDRASIRKLDAAGYVAVPIEPTDEMIEAGILATAAYLDIPGSAATVNREKMRRRFQAMVAVVRARQP